MNEVLNQAMTKAMAEHTALLMELQALIAGVPKPKDPELTWADVGTMGHVNKQLVNLTKALRPYKQ